MRVNARSSRHPSACKRAILAAGLWRSWDMVPRVLHIGSHDAQEGPPGHLQVSCVQGPCPETTSTVDAHLRHANGPTPIIDDP
jgi:hypothetical protein